MKTGSRFSGDVLKDILLLPVLICGIAESACGLFQVFGWGYSRHALFSLTGHFDNPGPFGGFVAACMAVSGAYLIEHRDTVRGWWQNAVKVLAGASFVMGLLVLPASMSRGAWLALASALAMVALRDCRIKEAVKKRRWIAPVAIVTVAALFLGMIALKKDSALGRLHIWRIEARAMVLHPLGTGRGTVLGTYGEAQEAFFRERLETVSPSVVRVAGCPEYAFNEYLHAGVEYGIPGLLVFIALIALALAALLRAGSSLAYGLAAWAVFAFFSYPLSPPLLNGMLAYFLICAALEGPRKMACKVLCVFAACTASFMIWTRGTEYPPFRELYDTGYGLFQEGRYEEALEPLSRGAAISSDPMFHVIIGRCHEASGHPAEAAAEYLKAHYMVPCRLYPLQRMMHLQISCGDDAAAVETGEKILSMPVNERQLTMMRLQDEVRHSLDSLKTQGI